MVEQAAGEGEFAVRVEKLSESPEIRAMKFLDRLMIEDAGLSYRHRRMLVEAYLPAVRALREKLEAQGYTLMEIDEAMSLWVGRHGGRLDGQGGGL